MWKESYTLAVTYKAMTPKERVSVRRKLKKYQFTHETLGAANLSALKISQMEGVAKVEVFRMLLVWSFIEGKGTQGG